MTGASLVGITYKPLFPYFADRADNFRVLSDGYVTASTYCHYSTP
jgi:isoleucyl-tRNA synthetase